MTFDVVNSSVERAKRRLTYPDVEVQVCLPGDILPERLPPNLAENLGVGGYRYLYTGKSPIWARFCFPERFRWLDIVTSDVSKKVRIERGAYLAERDEGVEIIEESKWWQPENSPSTYFRRCIIVRLQHGPGWFVNSCLGLYKANTLSARDNEAKTIRADLAQRPILTDTTRNETHKCGSLERSGACAGEDSFAAAERAMEALAEAAAKEPGNWPDRFSRISMSTDGALSGAPSVSSPLLLGDSGTMVWAARLLLRRCNCQTTAPALRWKILPHAFLVIFIWAVLGIFVERALFTSLSSPK